MGRIAGIFIVLLGLVACSADLPAPTRAHCLAYDLTTELATAYTYRADLLFVIDDSPSMAKEQAALQTELPDIVNQLITGEFGDGNWHEPLDDLQVGVVSASLADAGGFHHTAASGSGACAGDYPAFLHYRGPYFGPNRDDLSTYLSDFGCVAQVGTGGKGPSQPLQAALTALSNPNSGFLRNDPGFLGILPSDYPGRLQIVIVTDSDDCSLRSDLTPGNPPPTTTAACAAERSAELQSIDYYYDALRALRGPGNEGLVRLSVITGAPPALVAETGFDKVEFGTAEQRDAYYQHILDDPAMQSAPDPNASGQLRPACDNERATAEPGRRLIQIAQRFGFNGAATSICGDEWHMALKDLNWWLTGQLSLVCLPRTIPRQPDGRVPCRVYWDLPPPATAPDGTPTRCSERSYLRPADGEPRVPGGAHCEMQQVVLSSEAELAAVDAHGGGWFYDDFSSEVRNGCTGIGGPNRKISFTEFARPQAGGVVTLNCFQAQVLPTNGDDAGAPSAEDEAACGAAEPW